MRNVLVTDRFFILLKSFWRFNPLLPPPNATNVLRNYKNPVVAFGGGAPTDNIGTFNPRRWGFFTLEVELLIVEMENCHAGREL